LENIRNGEDFESKEEVENEQNAKEGDQTMHLLSFLSNRGSVRVEFSCYDGILKNKTPID
jgi:hypothetical protein